MKTAYLFCALVAAGASLAATAHPSTGGARTANASSYQLTTVERLRGGTQTTDPDTARRQLNDSMSAECTALGGTVTGFNVEVIKRSDGLYQVDAELDCQLD